MYGMTLSIIKTKILIFGECVIARRSREEEGPMTIRGEEIEVVEEFRYLGSIITSRVGGKDVLGGMWVEIEARKKGAGRAFGMLRKCIFKNKSLSINTKILIYKITVLPILLYASETWSLTTAQLLQVEAFHMKCLRSICNISLLDKHTNIFILNKCKCLSVTNLLSRNRWAYFGRIMALDLQTRWMKRIMCGRVEGGKRKTGKVPLRWSDLTAKEGRDLLDKEGIEMYEHEWLTYQNLAMNAYLDRKKKKQFRGT
jgi:hypothetical protein